MIAVLPLKEKIGFIFDFRDCYLYNSNILPRYDRKYASIILLGYWLCNVMIITLFLHAPVGTACQMLFLTYHYIQIAKKNTKPTLVGTNDAFTRNRKIAERCNFALIMFTIDKLLLFCILKPTTIRRFFFQKPNSDVCAKQIYSPSKPVK